MFQHFEIHSHHSIDDQVMLYCHDVTVTSVLSLSVQEFDQFVKRRLKDEYKEKKSKLQKAREEFKQLLEEAKITSRYLSFMMSLLNQHDVTPWCNTT